MSKKQSTFLRNWTDVGSPDSGIVRESATGREGERRIIALDPLYDTKNEQFIYNYRKNWSAFCERLWLRSPGPREATKECRETKVRVQGSLQSHGCDYRENPS